MCVQESAVLHTCSMRSHFTVILTVLLAAFVVTSAASAAKPRNARPAIVNACKAPGRQHVAVFTVRYNAKRPFKVTKTNSGVAGGRIIGKFRVLRKGKPATVRVQFARGARAVTLTVAGKRKTVRRSARVCKPAISRAPAVSGVAQPGGTLRASRGRWLNRPTRFRYQWQTRRTASARWTNVARATRQAFRVPAGHAELRVLVRAKNRGGWSRRAPSKAVRSGSGADDGQPGGARASGDGQPGDRSDGGHSSGDASRPGDNDNGDGDGRPGDNGNGDGDGRPGDNGRSSPPTPIAPPNVSDNPGGGLIADPGVWYPDVSTTTQWQRCETADPASCADIPGATSPGYVPGPEDYGRYVRAQITATSPTGQSTVIYTPIIGPLPAAQPTLNTAPTITGTAIDGAVLTTDGGSWNGSIPMLRTYQWERLVGGEWVTIPGADNITYQLTGADYSAFVRVRVTADNAIFYGGSSAGAVSDALGPVIARAVQNTAAPQLTGSAQADRTLTVSTGTWTGTEPITYSYQWQRHVDGEWENIAAATSGRYTLTAEDIGLRVRAAVTATNATLVGGDTAQAFTDATTQVAPAEGSPTNVSAPTVSGTPTDAMTLTATDGAWEGDDPIRFESQWQRSTADSWENIAGQTALSYRITSADVGSRLRMQITASNSRGTAVAHSAPTTEVQAAPPLNLTAPAITGQPIHMSELQATAGTWSGTAPITYAFQWQRSDGDGEFVNISGATADRYTPALHDIGHELRVEVTASNRAASVRAASSPAEVQAMTPVNDTAPQLNSTTAVDGDTLTVTDGEWSGTEPIAISYQWQRNTGDGWEDITGQTDRQYTTATADANAQVRATVTASNAGGSVSVETAAASVSLAAPVNVTQPTIRGTAAEGRTLIADIGSWRGSLPIRFSVQWQRNTGDGWEDIAGQTDFTYGVSADDIGVQVRVAVTAVNAAGTEFAASDGVEIAAVAPTNEIPPAVSGIPSVAMTLTADAGRWAGSAPLTYRYQWQREGELDVWENIDGAVAASYQPVSADADSRLRVQVTASNSAGSAEAFSDPTDAVSNPPQNITPPSISGIARIGETLTADPGSWQTDEDPEFTYQWLNCDSSGDRCQPISGQTDSALTVTGTMASTSAAGVRTISVEVTAADGRGQAVSVAEPTASVPGQVRQVALVPRNGRRPLLDIPDVQNGDVIVAVDHGVETYYWFTPDMPRVAGNALTEVIAGQTRRTHAGVYVYEYRTGDPRYVYNNSESAATVLAVYRNTDVASVRAVMNYSATAIPSLRTTAAGSLAMFVAIDFDSRWTTYLNTMTTPAGWTLTPWDAAGTGGRLAMIFQATLPVAGTATPQPAVPQPAPNTPTRPAGATITVAPIGA
jgi:hypothetical protein